MDMTANLEAMLARGQDSATLRFTLASRYLEAGENAKALEHGQAAVELDPEYSAAWKVLGKAQAVQGLDAAAAATFRQGIEIAERRGDRQAAREMEVFLRRLERAS